jgi:hypothetical protein
MHKIMCTFEIELRIWHVRSIKTYVNLFLYLFSFTLYHLRDYYIYIYIYVGLVATYEVKNTGVVFRYMPVKS